MFSVVNVLDLEVRHLVHVLKGSAPVVIVSIYDLKTEKLTYCTISVQIRGCGGTVTYNQTYLQNPSFPGTYTISTGTTCTYTFKKLATNVCQVAISPK